MAKAPAKETAEISVLQISQGTVKMHIVGNLPFIYNAMSVKAKRELLLPKGRKTAADRAQTLKHEPLNEYRESVYRVLSNTSSTRLCFPTGAFKKAIATAALDLPGTKKAEIGRLVSVPAAVFPIWGVPQLMMSVVRSADMNKTPDIRTRAILPEWATIVELSFVRPKLSATSVVNLLAAAGITVGVGDFRQEKGAGSYGSFRIVEPDDADFKRITKAGGRAAQDAALESPEMYDSETEALFSYFNSEVARMRQHDGGATKKGRKKADPVHVNGSADPLEGGALAG